MLLFLKFWILKDILMMITFSNIFFKIFLDHFQRYFGIFITMSVTNGDTTFLNWNVVYYIKSWSRVSRDNLHFRTQKLTKCNSLKSLKNVLLSKFYLICTFWAATCHMTRFGSINDWWTWLDNPLSPGRGKTTGILKLGVLETVIKKKKML